MHEFGSRNIPGNALLLNVHTRYIEHSYTHEAGVNFKNEVNKRTINIETVNDSVPGTNEK